MKKMFCLSPVRVLALALLLLPCLSAAQNMEVISYAPLKDAGATSNFAYQSISVKSRAYLATGAPASVVVTNLLTSNSSTLFFQSNRFTFSTPVRVRNDAFSRPMVRLSASNMYVNGYFYGRKDVGGIGANVDIRSAKVITARNVVMYNTNILLGSEMSKMYIGGVRFVNPMSVSGCNTIGWKAVTGVDKDGSPVTAKILMCVT